LKRFCSPFHGASNVTKINKICFKIEQDMAYISERGEKGLSSKK
jgi:hypothetical protein